jgi:SNF2 family DNA or RNA helicase
VVFSINIGYSLTSKQDMGLGKTLSMLALIAGSLNETQESQEQAKQATLIVSPLSSKSWFYSVCWTHTN